MNSNLSNRLSAEISRQFDGDTWYSSNFKQVIKNIAAEDAVKKFNGFPNSIAEIVRHMTQWKIFCLKKLEGDSKFDIEDPDEDWMRFSNLTEEEWLDILAKYETTNINLIRNVKDLSDDTLDQIVPGRKYSYYYLLMGIIEHDVWHTMQIKFIKRLLQIPETD